MDYKNTLLEKIVHHKKEEISSHKYQENLASLRSRGKDLKSPKDFFERFDSLKFKDELPQTRIIAEIKKASPSAGLIKPEFDPIKIANQYEAVGAAALSVLTDAPYFQGSLQDLQQVSKSSSLPTLRKDFLIDPYQIYEARAFGADCILLIVAILEKQQLVDLAGLSAELEMSILIEVHNKEELDIALQVKEQRLLMGINNRDLKTLKIDLKTTEQLFPFIPSKTPVVSESGISQRKEIEHYQSIGIKGFLIGETFLKAPSLQKKFRELAGLNE